MEGFGANSLCEFDWTRPAAAFKALKAKAKAHQNSAFSILHSPLFQRVSWRYGLRLCSGGRRKISGMGGIRALLPYDFGGSAENVLGSFSMRPQASFGKVPCSRPVGEKFPGSSANWASVARGFIELRLRSHDRAIEKRFAQSRRSCEIRAPRLTASARKSFGSGICSAAG